LIRENPYYLFRVTWRASAKTIYGFVLTLLGMLYLAVVLAQLEAAVKTQTLPILELMLWSVGWLSPGWIALLSAWCLGAGTQSRLGTFWALLAPVYAMTGWLVYVGPAWLRETVIGPWPSVAELPSNPVSASIWLAALIVIVGGTVFLSTFAHADKNHSQPR
jgi:hypothetical protein